MKRDSHAAHPPGGLRGRPMLLITRAVRLPLMTGRLLLLVGLILPAELSAQWAVQAQRFRPNVKDVWSRSKEFVADVNFDTKVTQVSRVVWQGNMGRGTPVWSMQGAFSLAWLSNDGEHLVAGFEGGTLVPPNYDKDQVMLTFFRRDKMIHQLRLHQLVKDFSRLEKSATNLRWARYYGLNTCGYFVLETVEGREFLFDVTTGQAPKLKSAKAYETPASKTFRDLLMCFEFQYPQDYLLKQDRDYQGTPMGWISLIGAQNKDWSVEGRIEDTADYPRESVATSFAEFAFDRAGVMYSADGPNGSTYSGGVVRERRFVNRGGLDVIEFYLKIVRETYFEEDDKTTVENRTVGPIYAVSIGGPGEPLRVLLLRLSSDQEEQPPRGDEILKQIADSVRRGLTSP